MRHERLQARVDTLAAIDRTAHDALGAIADRDLDGMQAIGEERERLFRTLREVDEALAAGGDPAAVTPAERALRERGDALLRGLVTTEETLRTELAQWRDETGTELRGMRRHKSARRAYAHPDHAG